MNQLKKVTIYVNGDQPEEAPKKIGPLRLQEVPRAGEHFFYQNATMNLSVQTVVTNVEQSVFVSKTGETEESFQVTAKNLDPTK